MASLHKSQSMGELGLNAAGTGQANPGSSKGNNKQGGGYLGPAAGDLPPLSKVPQNYEFNNMKLHDGKMLGSGPRASSVGNM